METTQTTTVSPPLATSVVNQPEWHHWLGSGIAMAAVSALTQGTGVPLMLGSLGATCMILFCFSESPLARTHAVLAAHCLSSGIGLICLHALGPSWLSLGIAMTTSVGLMMMLRVPHPPAASNSVIVFATNADWALLFTTFAGVVIVLGVAFLWKFTIKHIFIKFHSLN